MRCSLQTINALAFIVSQDPPTWRGHLIILNEFSDCTKSYQVVGLVRISRDQRGAAALAALDLDLDLPPEPCRAPGTIDRLNHELNVCEFCILQLYMPGTGTVQSQIPIGKYYASIM